LVKPAAEASRIVFVIFLREIGDLHLGVKTLRPELTSVQPELTSVQPELASLHPELAGLQVELASPQAQGTSAVGFAKGWLRQY
jgi:hypothetical protein